MKKRLAMVLVGILMLVMFSSCASSSEMHFKETEPTAKEESNTEITVPNIQGKNITAASVFSEGRAFVQLSQHEEKTYCINEKGQIFFEVDMKVPASNEYIDGGGTLDVRFVNGLAVLASGDSYETDREVWICDREGNITKPEDVGVTSFSGAALAEGYILAEKVTATFDSVKNEMGIMNTDFEWTVEPSESLYEVLYSAFHAPQSTGPLHFYNGLYVMGNGQYLDLKTGDVRSLANMKCPSDRWSLSYSYVADTGEYCDFRFFEWWGRESVALDLSDMANIHFYPGMWGTAFIDGKYAVAFYNREANRHFATLIDEKGNHLFTPLEFPGLKDIRLSFDGEYLVVLGTIHDPQPGKVLEERYTLWCYNAQGVLMGTKEYDEHLVVNDMNIHDGIIGVYSRADGYQYYRPNFERLF